MRGILDAGLARGALIQGHAPKLTGGAIAAYALAGPRDNHSIRADWEVVENLHAGLYADLQENSLGASTMGSLVAGLRGMLKKINASFAAIIHTPLSRTARCGCSRRSRSSPDRRQPFCPGAGRS